MHFYCFKKTFSCSIVEDHIGFLVRGDVLDKQYLKIGCKITESFCYIPKTNATLLINYNIKLKKKKYIYNQSFI